MFYADLHVHSRYSYATSKFCTPEGLHQAAIDKGISVIGSSDFTHPYWLQELKAKFKPTGNGLFQLKNHTSSANFILSTEVSCIYRQDDKVRKVHLILLAPDFKTVVKINDKFKAYGRLDADGRPTLKLSARDLTEIVLNINEKCMIIPAHIWTPWFGMLGSKSGFDSLEECFGNMSKQIFAVETGLSSDVPMNNRISFLNNKTLISCSDLHSAEKAGRNATVFTGEISYDNIYNSLKNGSVSTVDLFPEEGKYFHDGHRKCSVSMSPRETATHNGICPVCGKPLTHGVLYRNQLLADQPDHGKRKFQYIIPLKEILSYLFQCGQKTKKVENAYRQCQNQSPELPLLLDISIDKIEQIGIPKLANAIKAVREGRVKKTPGYDGQPGIIIPLID